MSTTDITLVVIAAGLIFVAGLLASAEAALSSISKVRADELVKEGRGGAARLADMLADAPRYISTTLLVRLLLETSAVVLVTIVVVDLIDPATELGLGEHLGAGDLGRPG